MIYYTYNVTYSSNASKDDLGDILMGIGSDYVQIHLTSSPDMSNRPFSAYLLLTPHLGGSGPSMRMWVHARAMIVGHREDIRQNFGRIKNNYTGNNLVKMTITDAPVSMDRLSIAVSGERIPSSDDTAQDTFAKVQIQKPFYYAFHYLYTRSGGATNPTLMWLVGSFYKNETVTDTFELGKVGYGADFVELRSRQYANTIAVYTMLCKSPIVNNP